MKNNRFYLFPIIALTLPILLWIAALVRFYLAIHELKTNIYYYSFLFKKFSEALTNFWINFFIALMLSEILTYWFIRKKIYFPLWTLLHAGMSLVAFLIFPLIGGLFDLNPFNEPRSVTFLQIKLLFLLPFILGHVFFLLTIVNSFKTKPATTTNETTGLLDEFVNRT